MAKVVLAVDPVFAANQLLALVDRVHRLFVAAFQPIKEQLDEGVALPIPKFNARHQVVSFLASLPPDTHFPERTQFQNQRLPRVFLRVSDQLGIQRASQPEAPIRATMCVIKMFQKLNLVFLDQLITQRKQ